MQEKEIIMSIRFGTGGWRAVIGDDFTKANIRILAEAMARKMKAENARMELAIGYDRRFLAKEAVQWAAEVLAAEGVTVRFVNRSSPTPLIMYYVMAHDLDYGMMVTASHNPSLYNGFKVFKGRTRTSTRPPMWNTTLTRWRLSRHRAMRFPASATRKA